MSRIAKWKLEKTKVKAVFRLQFHATDVPQSGWDKLFISLISVDTGKPTAKTTKASVRNGTCKWADPIYETTRLLQNAKSKQHDEKLCKLVVAMGTSRGSILGEAIINLADYADALKPFATALPLQGCNFGTVLHVTVQLLTSKTGFREFEQQREQRERGFQPGVDGQHGDSATGKISHSEDTTIDQMDKEKGMIRLSSDAKELSSVEEDIGPSEEYADSGVGFDGSSNTFDGSSNTSESLYAEKHETSSSQEIDCHELAMAREENNRLSRSLELAESSILDLNMEVNSLQSLADELGNETRKFSDVIVTERSSAEELRKEISVMKLDCLQFKEEIERLKDLNHGPQVSSQPNTSIEWLKKISLVEDRIREIQSKAYIGFHEGDRRIIYSELETLLAMLRDFRSENGDQYVLANGIPLFEKENILMRSQILDLVRELDEAKVEREGLVRKMAQMECYYESLIHELEENQKRLIAELQSLTNEHSTCLYSLSANRDEIEVLHQDMNNQALRFADERRGLDDLNKELEKRASTSEAALRRARLNYSIAVEKLQKDLELLSSQVVSMFETNENIIKHAIPESSPPSSQGQAKTLQSRAGGDVLVEDLKRSLYSQEGLYQKVEEELREMHSMNLILDVHSKTLQETLVEANAAVKMVNGKCDKLVTDLEISNSVKDQLTVNLKKAMDDIEMLNAYKLSCIAQCSEMAFQNQVLEDKLESISKENYLLLQKKERFETCLAENAELLIMLKNEASENMKLQNEISVLTKNLRMLKAESDELASTHENLQENISFVKDKVDTMLSACSKQFCLDFECTDLKDAILQLEEIHQSTTGKILQLMEEKKILQGERVEAEMSLSTARSEILVMKRKFKNDMDDMAAKLVVSNALVDNLQVQFKSVAEKFNLTSDIEERSARKNGELLDYLGLLQDQFQELTSKNGHIGREMLGLDALAEELGSNNLTIHELIREKNDLMVSLQDKDGQFMNLASEISQLEENLKTEKGSKDDLEGKIQDLMSQFNEEREKVINLEQQKTDLEVERSRLCQHLEQQKGVIERLQTSLFEIQDYCIAADVKLAYSRNQYETLLGDHVQKFEGDMKKMAAKLVLSNALVDNLRLQIESVAEKFHLSSEIEGKAAQTNRELLADFALLQDQIARDMSGLDALADELQTNNSTITDLVIEKKDLMVSLQDKIKESIELASEVSCLKESLKKLHEELLVEKGFKDELERNIGNLMSQLNQHFVSEAHSTKENLKILQELQIEKDLKEEVKVKIRDLEGEKLRLCCLSEQQKGLIEKLQKSLSEVQDYSVSADVKLAYITHQYEALLEDHVKHRTEESVELVSEISCLKENLKNWHEELLTEKGLKDALEVKIEDLTTQLTQHLASEARLTEENGNLLNSIKSLRSELEASVAQNEELEIFSIVLTGKVDEQYTYLTSLENNRDEVVILQSRCNELSHKLSQQVMKTEEFKNLSIHLKALKDKAEAEVCEKRECCEKRESEQRPVVMQDSLRIAFIKEQYETKVQELKQQLTISKKHVEEMLMKLQDSIDEIENRKKSEAVNSKRINELSHKLAELEKELQNASAEKREKVNAFDLINAELECVALSLEYCKEEKEKLEASFRECEREKSGLSVELDLIKEQLEQFRSSTRKEENDEVADAECVLSESSGNSTPKLLCSMCSKELVTTQSGGELPHSNGKTSNVDSDLLATQRLKSSMEHLHEELEKMKAENTHLVEDRDFVSGFHVPQELEQLHKVNKQLRSMFPSFDEISSNENPLERVLALEIELAESLKAKNKSNMHFQSSFLKQHSDEEAVFKSFRDINELIKQTLEIKGRHVAMEAELREMHDRYSQLSLQFAEVEGERQKLKMTLKNVRSSRKLVSP